MRRTSRPMQGAVRAYDLARGAGQPTPDFSVPDLIQFVEVVGDLSAVQRPARAPNHFALQFSRTPTVGERACAEIRAGSRAVSVILLHLQQAGGAYLLSGATIENDGTSLAPSVDLGPDARDMVFSIGDRVSALPAYAFYTLSPDIPTGPFHLEPGEILSVAATAVTVGLVFSAQAIEFAP